MKAIEAKFRCNRCKVTWDGLLQMTVRYVGQVEVIQWEPIGLDRHCPECAQEIVQVVEYGKEREYSEKEGV